MLNIPSFIKIDTSNPITLANSYNLLVNLGYISPEISIDDFIKLLNNEEITTELNPINSTNIDLSPIDNLSTESTSTNIDSTPINTSTQQTTTTNSTDIDLSPILNNLTESTSTETNSTETEPTPTSTTPETETTTQENSNDTTTQSLCDNKEYYQQYQNAIDETTKQEIADVLNLSLDNMVISPFFTDAHNDINDPNDIIYYDIDDCDGIIHGVYIKPTNELFIVDTHHSDFDDLGIYNLNTDHFTPLVDIVV
jgi:hypothetical protein